MGRFQTLLIGFAFAVVTPSVHASAAQYAGQWKRVSASTVVDVGSWGENCGPEPKSYSNKSVVEVEIVAQGSHLVFTKGGLRTDRCSSANPRLVARSEKVTGSRWERVCETPSDDSKYERDEYTYIAVNANRIEYRVKSKYDWTLKGDHCVLTLEEKRVFERTGSTEAEEPAAAGAEEAPATEPDEGAAEPAPTCERDGELKRLQVFPREAEIGPGERICFKAFGFDAKGCKFEVAAVWIARQAGVEVGGLISRGGCFQAGATAADSEGSYEILAAAEGKKTAAAVHVVFPDLSDLLHVRLDPARELGAADAGSPAASGAATVHAPAGAPLPIPAAAPSGVPVLLIVAICLVILVAAGVVVVVIVFRRRSASKRASLDDLDDDDWRERSAARQPAPRRAPVAAPAPAPAPAPVEPAKLTCPKCGEAFPEGARFCPIDGSVLSPLSKAPPAPVPASAPGMVCPKCHRAYGADARFCPHDSSKLVPYAEWRVVRRNDR
jgi:RNA polymerase subunit RPABC4/transcription elongation factor Spt4